MSTTTTLPLKQYLQELIADYDLKCTWVLVACVWLAQRFIAESSPGRAPLIAGLTILMLLVAKVSHDVETKEWEVWARKERAIHARATRGRRALRNTTKITVDYRRENLRVWHRDRA